MRSLEKHESTSFVTINEARRHLTASKSAFLRSIEYTRQCHERSKQVKFLRLEIVSLKSVAEMSLISAQISLKYWQSIGGYRALIEIRDAISFSQKCCKKIFAQDVYDIDGFSIYIDSLLLEWKSVLFLWPWYVVLDITLKSTLSNKHTQIQVQSLERKQQPESSTSTQRRIQCDS